MTEFKWLNGHRPSDMLEWLSEGNPSERKCRLFAIACCRRAWQTLADERCRLAVMTAEDWLDGKASQKEMEAASSSVFDYENELKDLTFRKGTDCGLALHLAYAVRFCVGKRSSHLSRTAHHITASQSNNKPGERLAQCHILRDIFGNPFCPVTLALTWLTAPVRQLAQAIYDDRAFDRLPLLADALEEAGCDNADILAHCRSDGPHVRGCWVVDLLTGRQ